MLLPGAPQGGPGWGEEEEEGEEGEGGGGGGRRVEGGGRPRRGMRGKEEDLAFWKVEPWGQHVLTHPPAFNFPCFLGILILFSGKLPAP